MGWRQVGWKRETRHKLCITTNRYPQLSFLLRQIFAELSKLAMKLITWLSFLSSWHYSPVLAWKWYSCRIRARKGLPAPKNETCIIHSLLLVNYLSSLILDQMKMKLSERKFIPRLFEAEKIEVTKHMWYVESRAVKHPESGGRNACCTQLFWDPGMQIEQVWLVYVPWTRAGLWHCCQVLHT